MDLKQNLKHHHVNYLSKIDDDFENQYIAARDRENRIYSVEEIRQLPDHKLKYAEEWKLRKEASEYLIKYLKKKNPSTVLEIGCGNGWLSNRISEEVMTDVIALDLNKTELESGLEAFYDKQLLFVYCDIFKEEASIFSKNVDIIILAASAQYFPIFHQLITRLKEFLTDQGEIHILDTPFYNLDEVHHAQLRSEKYYEQIGHPEMTKYYYHRKWNELEIINHQVLYQTSRWTKLFGKRNNPFPWIKITS